MFLRITVSFPPSLSCFLRPSQLFKFNIYRLFWNIHTHCKTQDFRPESHFQLSRKFPVPFQRKVPFSVFHSAPCLGKGFLWIAIVRNRILVHAQLVRFGNLLEKSMWKKRANEKPSPSKWLNRSGTLWVDLAQRALFPINKGAVCYVIKSVTDWLKCSCRLVPMGLPQQNTADHITLSNVVWKLSNPEIILQAGAHQSPITR